MACKALLEKTGNLLTATNPVRHWRHQRLTALALAPLSVWLIILLNKALHAGYAETLDWLTTPVNTAAIVAWIAAVFYHAALGVQVVIEDYVSTVPLRHGAIIAVNLVFLVLAVAALIPIIFIFQVR